MTDTLEAGTSPLPDNVALFPGVSDRPHDPSVMLRAALRADLEMVVIVGYLKDGSSFFASNEPDGPEVLWLLEKTKLDLLNTARDDT